MGTEPNTSFHLLTAKLASFAQSMKPMFRCQLRIEIHRFSMPLSIPDWRAVIREISNGPANPIEMAARLFHRLIALVFFTSLCHENLLGFPCGRGEWTAETNS
jgi:hypothetical protein